MKKLDDIMELLTDEINGFQNSIKKLESLSKGLNEVKVDTSKLEYHLKEQLRHQERIQSQNTRTLNDIKDEGIYNHFLKSISSQFK